MGQMSALEEPRPLSTNSALERFVPLPWRPPSHFALEGFHMRQRASQWLSKWVIFYVCERALISFLFFLVEREFKGAIIYRFKKRPTGWSGVLSVYGSAICGLTHTAQSWLDGPFARTANIISTVFPLSDVRSTSTAFIVPSQDFVHSAREVTVPPLSL